MAENPVKQDFQQTASETFSGAVFAVRCCHNAFIRVHENENGVKIVIECEPGQYMLTKARSYVYSYTSDMDYITVDAAKNQKRTITINLGKDYTLVVED